VNEWVAWHEQYRKGSPLTMRLAVVQDLIRAALDACAPGPIRIISMCAGDGRDLLGVLSDHPRRADVQARLVELDPVLAERGRIEAESVSSALEFVHGDAAMTSAYLGAVPADIVLVCGVFGNISDDDVRRTIEYLPTLCATGAAVIWTRGTFAPDLTPAIRTWFAHAGYTELAFVAIPDTTVGVGAGRMSVPPVPFAPGVTLFTFLAKGERPSQR
jgi:hypothetical protein